MENSTINMGHSFDWWKPLDPHDPGLIKSRPFRKVEILKFYVSMRFGCPFFFIIYVVSTPNALNL